MNCQEVKQELWSFFRGELSSEAGLSIERHLQSCSDCALKFENFKQVDRILSDFPSIEPSPYFDQKLNARLNQVPRVKPAWWGVLQMDPYIVRFALLLLATVGVWLGFRNYQARQLNSVDDVVRLQDSYIGKREPFVAKPNGPDIVSDAASSDTSPLNETGDQQIPEEDLPIVENLELLQNLDFLQQFDFADQAATREPSARKAN